MSLTNTPVQDGTASAPVSWVYHLTKENLKDELEKRSLPIEGTYAELRQRLLQNLRVGNLAISMPVFTPTHMTTTETSPSGLTHITPGGSAWVTQADPWETPTLIPTIVTATTMPTTSIITTISSSTRVTPSCPPDSPRSGPIN